MIRTRRPTSAQMHQEPAAAPRRHPRSAPALALVSLLAAACGSLPTFPDLGEMLGAVATIPPMPTPGFSEFELGPVWSVPEVPQGTLQPIVGAPPDWWYLVPVHRAAYLGGSSGRDYHYVVAVSGEEMTQYYEDVMSGGDWESFMGTLPSGSYSMMSYTRDDTTATIYVSPYDGGSLVSIIIE